MKKNYKLIKEKNGLTLIIAPKKESSTATILVLVAAGSKYEEKKENGISHFLEHMCFKGTSRRPRAIDITSELDSLGAAYNAFTAEEFTGYYAKVDPSHIENAIDIVADIYVNQIFRPEEIKKESGVIVEEINLYEDTPSRKIYDNFTSLLYGDQPAGWNIAGTKESVASINKGDLESYRGRHYVASATTVVVTGQFNEKKIIKSVRQHFNHIRISKKHNKLSVKESQVSPLISVDYRKSDQTHLMVGFRTFPITDERAITLKVLSTILGSGMSSRLFEIIRNKLGAAYYARSFTNLYTDHGYIAASVGANNEKVPEVLRAILKEFRSFKKNKVNNIELKKAKDYMKGKLSIGLETTDEVAEYYGLQNILENQVLEPAEVVKMINKVTAEDIQKLASKFFINSGLSLAIIGPRKDRKEFVPILRV